MSLISRPRLLGLALLAGVFAAGVGGQAAAQQRAPIMIVVDQAKVMRISRPAATVIIGNPSIADATIQDEQTLIITGRSFGTTNLIVLDSEGQPIADELLTVQASDQVITVFRRSERQTYTCSPVCQAALTVGDAVEEFEAVNTQIQARATLAEGN